MINVAVIGLGEAGRLFAVDLVASRVHTSPPSIQPRSRRRRESTAAPTSPTATAGADLVLVLTSAADADAVFAEIFDSAPAGAVVADLSTSAPRDKQQRAEVAAGRDLLFVDVALMTPVPGRGLAHALARFGCRRRALRGDGPTVRRARSRSSARKRARRRPASCCAA